jgi:hypothetical protein
MAAKEAEMQVDSGAAAVARKAKKAVAGKKKPTPKEPAPKGAGDGAAAMET